MRQVENHVIFTSIVPVILISKSAAICRVKYELVVRCMFVKL